MRHKHYNLILEWACGAEIEFFRDYGDGDGEWVNSKYPVWHEDREYRIKTEPKPDVVLYAHANSLMDECNAFISNARGFNSAFFSDKKANIKLTYDGETKELKYVEKI